MTSSSPNATSRHYLFTPHLPGLSVPFSCLRLRFRSFSLLLPSSATLWVIIFATVAPLSSSHTHTLCTHTQGSLSKHPPVIILLHHPFFKVIFSRFFRHSSFFFGPLLFFVIFPNHQPTTLPQPFATVAPPRSHFYYIVFWVFSVSFSIFSAPFFHRSPLLRHTTFTTTTAVTSFTPPLLCEEQVFFSFLLHSFQASSRSPFRPSDVTSPSQPPVLTSASARCHLPRGKGSWITRDCTGHEDGEVRGFLRVH